MKLLGWLYAMICSLMLMLFSGMLPEMYARISEDGVATLWRDVKGGTFLFLCGALLAIVLITKSRAVLIAKFSQIFCCK